MVVLKYIIGVPVLFLILKTFMDSLEKAIYSAEPRNNKRE